MGSRGTWDKESRKDDAMLIQKMKLITADEAKDKLKLTDHEYNLLKYYQGDKRAKDINDICIQLGMSKPRFAKTKRSLTSKLNKL